MRNVACLGLSMLLVFASCHSARASSGQHRIFFVGNSLTYVGNLPAVFSALARANGHAVSSYMVVSPGGTLSERMADGSVARGLRKCHCSTMILQERGGDLFDLFGHKALAQSRQAIKSLARMGHADGATVVLLGTYNSLDISHHLVAMEGAAAHEAGIPYIAVSEQLWRLHQTYPSLQWLRKKEGGHPGKALTLLDAILVYKQLYGTFPAAKSFVVHAPIYGIHTGLKAKLRRADAPPPATSAIHTPKAVSYSAQIVGEIVAALKIKSANKSPQPTAQMLRSRLRLVAQ